MKYVCLFIPTLIACSNEVKTQVVNTEPSAVVLNPVDGSAFEVNELIEFRGQVSDSEQAENSLIIQWTSDKDGELNTDPANSSGEVSFATVNLTEGSHVITLQVTDNSALQAKNYVVITVGDPDAGEDTGDHR